MELRILGPLEVVADGRPLPLGGPRQRAVLARLALDAGRVVTAETLAEDVWAGRQPATAAKTLQKYVSELRKALPSPEVVRTRGSGYVLDIDADAIDARRFERLVSEGSRAVAAGDPAVAGCHLTAALALWRGGVLADLPDCRFADPERARLGELRLVANEERLAAEVALGRHGEVTGELAELVEAHPLRERLWASLMLALYRSGRQVEALRAFERHRRQLAEEVGVEPAPALRELEA
ncbi:MAG: AfsR/SARP family transcriptional regulator, partial [Actinomycetota bacterium]